jgi:hypothetical protein
MAFHAPVKRFGKNNERVGVSMSSVLTPVNPALAKKDKSYLLGDCAIYGWADLEELILTPLITGDAGLLLGSKGANKTNGLRNIAALVLDDKDREKGFHAYSAPNDEFEDLIGIPDPSGMREGVMRYIVSDVSIWNKVFVVIDEINRANPQLQGKYLQLLLSREILGKRTSVIWMWGAMNPLSYLGTNPLDAAMADRFAVMLRVPEFQELNEQEKILAIGNQGADSLFGLSYWNPDLRTKLVENNSFSSQRLARARERFQDIRKEMLGVGGEEGLLSEVIKNYGDPVAQFLASSTEGMADKYRKETPDIKIRERQLELLISGRRASMMWRTIVTRLALHNILTGSQPRKSKVADLVLDTYLKSITVSATGAEFDQGLFTAVFPGCVSVVSTVGNLWDHRIETERSPIKKLAMTLIHKLDETGLSQSLDVEDAIERLLTIPNSANTEPNAKIEDLSPSIETGGLLGTGALDKHIVPALCALYTGCLVELRSEVMPNPIRARIANKASAVVRLLHRIISPDEWPLFNEKVAAEIGRWDERLTMLSAERNDPFYKASHVFFSLTVRALTTKLMKVSENEEYWITQIRELGEGIVQAHEDIYRYLLPAIRILWYRSYLPTGMTPEQYERQVRVLDRRFRNQPDDEPVEETREEKEERLLTELMKLNPALASRLKLSAQEFDEIHASDDEGDSSSSSSGGGSGAPVDSILGVTPVLEVKGPQILGTVSREDGGMHSVAVGTSEEDDEESSTALMVHTDQDPDQDIEQEEETSGTLIAAMSGQDSHLETEEEEDETEPLLSAEEEAELSQAAAELLEDDEISSADTGGECRVCGNELNGHPEENEGMCALCANFSAAPAPEIAPDNSAIDHEALADLTAGADIRDMDIRIDDDVTTDSDEETEEEPVIVQTPRETVPEVDPDVEALSAKLSALDDLDDIPDDLVADIFD